MDKVRSA